MIMQRLKTIPVYLITWQTYENDDSGVFWYTNIRIMNYRWFFSSKYSYERHKKQKYHLIIVLSLRPGCGYCLNNAPQLQYQSKLKQIT